MRVLFVCTANLCRSQVAAEVFRVLTWTATGRQRHEARSAGTNPPPGGRPVTEADLEWADVVCVMEPEHAEQIRARWATAIAKIRVLGIPDIYSREDPELKDLLTTRMRRLLLDAARDRDTSDSRSRPS